MVWTPNGPQRKRARPEERALSQIYVRTTLDCDYVFSLRSFLTVGDGEFDFLAFGE